MKFEKEQLLLYAITDRRYLRGRSLEEQVEEALRGGATMIQLREKDLSDQEFIEEAKALKAVCSGYGVPLIINDRVDVALEAGADGVHVGMEDESVGLIRKRVGQGFIIGSTAKTVQQARMAEIEGADYIGVGAVFPSPTKEKALGITLEEFKNITSSVSIPSVAIGGISRNNMVSLRGGGMSGVALISAIFSSDDIVKTVKELKKSAENICR